MRPPYSFISLDAMTPEQAAAFTRPVLAVKYDTATGRILEHGRSSWGLMEFKLHYGEPYVTVDRPDADVSPADHYVDPATKDVINRPILAVPAAPIRLAPNEEHDVLDVGAAKVTVSGPVSETFDHEAGMLTLGFAMVGTYTVTIEAFPCRAADITIIVEDSP